MYTLFISTFSELITIGLLKDGKEIDRLEQVSSRNHSIYTIPMIEELLDKNEIKKRLLQLLTYCKGRYTRGSTLIALHKKLSEKPLH